MSSLPEKSKFIVQYSDYIKNSDIVGYYYHFQHEIHRFYFFNAQLLNNGFNNWCVVQSFPIQYSFFIIQFLVGLCYKLDGPGATQEKFNAG